MTSYVGQQSHALLATRRWGGRISVLPTGGGLVLGGGVPLLLGHVNPYCLFMATLGAIIMTSLVSAPTLVWIQGKERRKAHACWSREMRSNLLAIKGLADTDITQEQRARLYETVLSLKPSLESSADTPDGPMPQAPPPLTTSPGWGPPSSRHRRGTHRLLDPSPDSLRRSARNRR